jgi:hypothetical protein
MKCTNCGAELASEDRFCGECGAPRPQLPPRFAEAEQRFTALRARYQVGELDDAAYEAELQKLVVVDSSGGYWMLGADSGEWYWYDGQQWARRDPPLAGVAVERPQARPAPPPAVAPPMPAAPPARKGLPWNWIAVGCGGLLIVAVVVVGVLAVPRLLPFVSTPVKPTAVVAAPTATRTAMLLPTATPTVEPTATAPRTATPTLELAATPLPTATPTATPPVEPTATPLPTATPTVEPTAVPTAPPLPTATPVKITVLEGKLVYTVYNIDFEYLETVVVTVDGRYVLSVPNAIQPAFSSDGKWLAFRSIDPGGIGVMNLETRARQTLTGIVQDSHPRFNPESHDIVFSRDDRLYLVDVVSQPTVREVGDSALMHVGIAAGRFPDWCRVAHKTPEIVYSGFAGGGVFGLMLTTPVYDVHYAITQEPGDTMPAWSPDCTQIAFAREEGGNWDIYVINPNGSGRSRLTSDGAIEFAPVWSPAGDSIAFLSNRDGRWAIWVMDPNGQNPRELIEIEDRIHTFRNPLEQCIDWAP